MIKGDIPSAIPKCLLVDDLKENLIALQSLLEDENVEIHTATSGTQALELLLKNDYALSLLDVQMPEMDGIELAEIMRSTEKTKSIPIIFVTAGTDNDVNRIFMGYDAGAVDFLQKPLYPKIVLGKVRVFLDLYNQKKLLEETFRRTNEELENKVQERTQALLIANNELEAFSYSVSHDLRAPLRSMDGFSKALLLQYGEKLDEKGKDYLVRVRDSAQKMGELIDGMLILSRLGRKEIQCQDVNLSQMCGEITKELMDEFPEKKVDLTIMPDMNVLADPALLFSVMENLLENAWKYSSKVPLARIEVGFFEENRKTIYYVKDNGAGFDMEYVNKLFNAFQRLHNIKDFPGTGIGLVTVKRIIERHGGKVWAEGEVDKGSAFYFTLPQRRGT
jgi:signal transduction histidine kinase